MKALNFLLIFGLTILSACRPPDGETRDERATVAAGPAERLDQLTDKMQAYLPQLPVDSMKIPRALESDGTLIATPARQWTSGFFPGTLWQLYAHSKQGGLKAAAEQWTEFVRDQQYDDHTHDLGFKVYCSFGEGYELTQNPDYKAVIIQASKTLIRRFYPKVGAIRSWDWNADVWQFPVIIDNMMNLEMLFEATRLTGDSTYYNVALEHARTTLANHFREDHSSFHVVDFDTLSGEVRMKVTHQGYSPESAWARGQAWGLYGFTMAYRYTREPVFLEKAKAIASFFFNHPNLPADKIPYWDFDAPNVPDEPRDASAAAVAASALLELMEYDTTNKDQYLNWADDIFASLALPAYQSDVPPFLLDHSTGSVPGEFEVDVPITYADYYYVEALRRRLAIE